MPLAYDDTGFLERPYQPLAALREGGAPVWCSRTSAWLVARYDDVGEVLRGAGGVFVPAPLSAIPASLPAVLQRWMRDWPDHQPLEAREHLNLRLAAEFPEDRVRSCATAHAAVAVSRVAGDRIEDLYVQVVRPACLGALADLIGVELAGIQRIAPSVEDWMALLASLGPERATVDRAQRAVQVLEAAWERDFARGRPATAAGCGPIASPGDLAALVHGALTAAAVVMNAVVTWSVHRALPDPEALEDTLQEIARFCAIVMVEARRATARIAIGGRTIRAGDRIHALLVAANRDPRRFPDPDRYDPGRLDVGHVTLGDPAALRVGARLVTGLAFGVLRGLLHTDWLAGGLSVTRWQVHLLLRHAALVSIDLRVPYDE